MKPQPPKQGNRLAGDVQVHRDLVRTYRDRSFYHRCLCRTTPGPPIPGPRSSPRLRLDARDRLAQVPGDIFHVLAVQVRPTGRAMDV